MKTQMFKSKCTHLSIVIYNIHTSNNNTWFCQQSSENDHMVQFYPIRSVVYKGLTNHQYTKLDIRYIHICHICQSCDDNKITRKMPVLCTKYCALIRTTLHIYAFAILCIA